MKFSAHKNRFTFAILSERPCIFSRWNGKNTQFLSQLAISCIPDHSNLFFKWEDEERELDVRWKILQQHTIFNPTTNSCPPCSNRRWPSWTRGTGSSLHVCTNITSFWTRLDFVIFSLVWNSIWLVLLTPLYFIICLTEDRVDTWNELYY